MLIAVIPFIVLIVGLLLWVLAANPKVSKAGEYMFFCGLLALMFALSGHSVRLG